MSQRDTLLGEQASWIQRMHKALVQMNIQLGEVLSDVMGATGQAIIRAIVTGERNAQVLAGYRDGRVKASKDEIARALQGNWRAEHLFVLGQALSMYDDIQRHMSTVSRATTNKYVHTPHGLFELKFFFSAAVKQQAGGDMAAEAIRSRIKGMVSEEDAKNPLSDQQIADNLKREGITVARRTVAKYREAMGILPSSRRKTMF